MVYKKSTKRTCITCTGKGVNKDDIPLWAKLDGVYSMLPKVINCEDKYNPNKTELKPESPKITGKEVKFTLTIQEKERWVFYWAAEAGSSLQGDVPDEPAVSYGDESNRGLVKTNKQGEAEIVLNCPKLYKEGSTVYPRHVHYTVLTQDNVWSTVIGTYEIMCHVDREFMTQVIKNKSYLILNALTEDSFDEKHIPTSILCDPSSLEGLTKQKKDGVIKQLIKQNLGDFPKLKKIKKDTSDVKQIPLIVYCQNPKSKATEKLVSHLFECSYFKLREKYWIQIRTPLVSMRMGL
jgi:hypothetical protein